MPQGSVNIILRDGGLGVIAANNSNVAVSMGTCSKVSAPTLYAFSQPDDVVSQLGGGPLVEDLCHRLTATGGTVYGLPLNPSVVGVIGSWSATRVGSSTGTVSTSSGLPADNDSLVVQIVSSGTGQLVTGGNVAIQVSLDGGTTYGSRVLVPTSGTVALTKAGGAVPQDRGNLVVALSASTTTFDSGDTFAAACQAPYYSTTDLAAGFTALLADPHTWGLVHVCGYPTAGNSSANATAAAAMNVACTTGMAAAFTAGRDARLILDMPPSTDADMTSAFASTPADARVTRAVGVEKITSSLTGAQRSTSHGTPLVARLCKYAVSHAPGVPDDGPLIGVVSTSRDERATPGLYDLGFTCARSIIGRTGVFADDGRTSAAAGSDFMTIMNCRVIDLVVQACRQAGLHFQYQNFIVDDQGHISAADAKNINTYVSGVIYTVAGTEFSSCSAEVYATDNVLSTGKLRFKIRVRPFFYAHDIEFDVGYVNPALLQAA